MAPSPVSWVIEVNECKVFATQKGATWWAEFRRANVPGRCVTVAPSLGGELVRVACSDRDHAEWLRSHMASSGLPGTALRVRQGQPVRRRKDPRP